MQLKVSGIQFLNFKNSNGETVSGTNIFGLFKDENVEGHRAEKFFVKDGINVDGIKANDVVEITFNMKGKVESVTKL